MRDSVLQRFVFGYLNVGNSKPQIKNIAEETFVAWYHIAPSVCGEARVASRHTLRVYINTNGVSVKFCLFICEVSYGLNNGQAE